MDRDIIIIVRTFRTYPRSTKTRHFNCNCSKIMIKFKLTIQTIENNNNSIRNITKNKSKTQKYKRTLTDNRENTLNNINSIITIIYSINRKIITSYKRINNFITIKTGKGSRLNVINKNNLTMD